MDKTSFFSAMAQESPYWLVVEGPAASSLPGLSAVHQKPELAGVKTASGWRDAWDACAAHLAKQPGAGAGYRVAVIAADMLPALPEVAQALKPMNEINAVAGNLWLADYINHGRLDCYMQQVVDKGGKPVGFEAFARMEGPDGGVIGGGAIMQAAHALRVEYQLDRLLHKQAIDCFTANDLKGYVFINFLTGFIHRPEVYLEGLSQAAARCKLKAGAVVLDVPLGSYAKDIPKLRSIADYCRGRGFLLALDDITNANGLAGLLAEIRPAFVKVDGKFSDGLTQAKAAELLQEIVRVSHANGVLVLAEGVETASRQELCIAAGVDMMQGYHFGAPQRFAKVAGKKPRGAA